MVLSHTSKVKKKAQHSPGVGGLVVGSPRFKANPGIGVGDALQAQVASNIRASTVVKMLENFTIGPTGGGESVAQRRPGSPIRLVPTVEGLVGLGIGKAKERLMGVQGDASEPP